MAECTDDERALLDAIVANRGIQEARAKVVRSKISQTDWDRAVATRRALAVASADASAAWDAIAASGVDFATIGQRAFDEIWNAIEAEARVGLR